MAEGGYNPFNKSLKYNRQVRLFFIRLALLGTVWFFVYHLTLKPARTIDRPLTNFLAAAVTKCINVLSPSVPEITWKETASRNAQLVQNGKKVFGIWDVCNGIDLMYIYVGIIVLLPYSIKRKLVFSFVGIAAIILANIVRIGALYYIYMYQRKAFDFSHHYLFTILMYILIFYGWLLYTKKGILTPKKVTNV
ncbi:MAG TPA: exosortase/archaeosortase family protein [Ferruginibacter sp.]|nr:exosortase/archaeosortase family protein [Ferruginibacter sp.]HMP19670.1 exosortase/archaeosortase family protein [Ferruginibacter sp.]